MGRKKKSRNRKLINSNKIPSPAAVVSSSSAPRPEASSSAVPPPPPWVELPGDVTANILQRLGAEEILRSAQRVCTTWWKVCQDPAMWRVISLLNPERMFTEYSTMCRFAVDRSQGQLVDLTIDSFGDDDLIEYIAERSSNLECLTLISCYNISGASLVQAVKILPHLVELHLTIGNNVLPWHVEAISVSCPKLESFSLNRRGCNIQFSRGPKDVEHFEGFDWNGYALAIGKSTPNLRHLQLHGNKMKNGGLEAILESCPRLKSLDIRHYFSLNLERDVRKIYRETIKDLKLLSYYGDYGSYDDYVFPPVMDSSILAWLSFSTTDFS